MAAFNNFDFNANAGINYNGNFNGFNGDLVNANANPDEKLDIKEDFHLEKAVMNILNDNLIANLKLSANPDPNGFPFLQLHRPLSYGALPQRQYDRSTLDATKNVFFVGTDIRIDGQPMVQLPTMEKYHKEVLEPQMIANRSSKKCRADMPDRTYIAKLTKARLLNKTESFVPEDLLIETTGPIRDEKHRKSQQATFKNSTPKKWTPIPKTDRKGRWVWALKSGSSFKKGSIRTPVEESYAILCNAHISDNGEHLGRDKTHKRLEEITCDISKEFVGKFLETCGCHASKSKKRANDDNDDQSPPKKARKEKVLPQAMPQLVPNQAQPYHGQVLPQQGAWPLPMQEVPCRQRPFEETPFVQNPLDLWQQCQPQQVVAPFRIQEDPFSGAPIFQDNNQQPDHYEQQEVPQPHMQEAPFVGLMFQDNDQQLDYDRLQPVQQWNQANIEEGPNNFNYGGDQPVFPAITEPDITNLAELANHDCIRHNPFEPYVEQPEPVQQRVEAALTPDQPGQVVLSQLPPTPTSMTEAHVKQQEPVQRRVEAAPTPDQPNIYSCTDWDLEVTP